MSKSQLFRESAKNGTSNKTAHSATSTAAQKYIRNAWCRVLVLKPNFTVPPATIIT